MTRFALLAALLAAACGRDVDLGGTSDAGPADVALLDAAPACAPCTTAQDCASAEACAQFAGDTFCATLCPVGNECASGDACQLVDASTGGTVSACIPVGGACAPVSGPTTDAGPLTKCGALNGPSVVSGCHACGRYSNDCQPNGCYGGYWCNTATRECVRPPKTCP